VNSTFAFSYLLQDALIAPSVGERLKDASARE
jgi:hypothetical protein